MCVVEIKQTILNRFTVSSEVRHFGTFLHILASLSSTVYELLRYIGRKLQLSPTPCIYLTPLLVVIPLDDLCDFWWVSCHLPDGQATIWCKISPKS